MKNILRLKPYSISNECYKINASQKLSNITKVLDKYNATNKSSLKFLVNNLSSELEYHGLKVVVCDEPNLFIRQILNNDESYTKIFIDNKQIKSSYVYHLHYFSKIVDFLNTKNNSVLHEYLKRKDIDKNNLEIPDFVVNKYYNFKDEYLEKITDVNFEKVNLLSYLTINDEYVNENNIDSILNIIKNGSNDKQTILINDYDILKLDLIVEKYIDDFNFIIFTNDMTKWISNFDFIECFVVINDFVVKEFKTDALEILNKKILIKYLQKSSKKNKNDSKLLIEDIDIC